MNIYEEIKSKLTNKEVAIHYLGQPKRISSNYALFSSPFREDIHPSFSVNEKGYVDFGNNKHFGDMIQFVKELKGYQYPYQAAQEIIEEFGLQIEIPEKAKNVREKKSKKKISELCFEKTDKNNMYV